MSPVKTDQLIDLLRQDGPLTVAELATRTGRTPAALRVSLPGLAASGRVVKVPAPAGAKTGRRVTGFAPCIGRPVERSGPPSVRADSCEHCRAGRPRYAYGPFGDVNPIPAEYRENLTERLEARRRRATAEGTFGVHVLLASAVKAGRRAGRPVETAWEAA